MMVRSVPLLLLAFCSSALAFVAPRPHHHAGISATVGRQQQQQQQQRQAQRRRHHNQQQQQQALFMSSSMAKKKENRLPPPPEDQLTMSGDIASLFLYSFMDHSVNDMYVDAMQSNDMTTASSIDPLNEFGASAHLPVWYDGLHTMVQKDQLLSVLNIPNVNYAPVLQTAGMASIVMTMCWLVSGWLVGAFLFQNTLECKTSHMLWVTGKTWLLTAALMVALALGSDAFVGAFPLSHQQVSLGGLTKADADYIFDSLTVLVTWRFMVSSMLGGSSE